MEVRRSHSFAARRLALEPLEDRRLLAIDFDLLKDINPLAGSASSNPSSMTEMNGVVYYIATSAAAGRELWRTDGTEAGTFLVKEINPANSDSTGNASPVFMANVGGALFFQANDDVHGLELWKSDGTAAGTVLVKDIQPGTGGSLRAPTFREFFMNVNGTLFFSANDGVHGEELWRSDGTVAGTVMVKDVRPGAFGSAPGLAVTLDGTFVFTAEDGVHGYELWRSDGSEAGTTLIKDIVVGANGYVFPHPVEESHAAVGSTLYFVVRQSGGGRLWRTDGTAEGTQQVGSVVVNTGYNRTFAVAGETLYFAGNDGVHGVELWKVNAAGDNVELVCDVRPGSDSSVLNAFTGVGDTLYFSASDGITPNTLWKSDGTAAGTVSLWTAGVGPTAPFSLHNAGGTLFFAAASVGTGNELWTSDGTVAGTRLVADIRPGIGASIDTSATASYVNLTFVGIGDDLYFRANDGVHGVELWKSDGTAAGTKLVRDVNAGLGSNVGPTTMYRGVAYFAANDGVHGSELWRSDGTPEGTFLLKDVATGSPHSTPQSLTVFNDRLYFWARNAAGVYGIWRTDGTTEGTEELISNFNGYQPTSGTGVNEELTVVGSRLFFKARDAVHGIELWSTDGTATGTAMVTNLRVGTEGSSPEHLVNLNGRLLFTATASSEVGDELFVSDGTAEGTQLVSDIFPGLGGSSNPSLLTRVGDVVYFLANDGVNGVELWKSDGTAAGTNLVKNIAPSDADSAIHSLTNVNGVLYFRASDGSESGLWRSDGSGAGTYRIAAISPTSLANVSGMLYFVGSDGTHGLEVWKYDPATDVAAMVKDIEPFPGRRSAPGSLTNVDGTLYFTASDGERGVELWQSDGSAAGTTLVYDFAVEGNGRPRAITRIGNRLMVAATTDGLGEELWVGQLPRPAGDYNDDGAVDGGDFLAWQRGFGSLASPAGSGADGDGDGTVNGADLDLWADHFREPTAGPAAVISAAALVAAEEIEDESDLMASSIAAVAGESERSETARDALFAAGDFSKLFATDGDGEPGHHLRRRGRNALARRG